ncbi:polysaccharide deacetylase family sporulation protein PdaB [Paenalkalicoccus suaedae]|uniref:Polysaccharide deacetylase family sporulation protein PdaB n=1 Tax=Paenalkalicoccus suaedae TaxID=2592382 RepID=A0A859FAM6_9BACI|nr:polysaccharide deacetylase family sporulation protein PdaB [Paenalkalicoccus suaedae]QKS69822.1 polysaccharide deacetylase family sporulation protein PdaB [Paenalkalicoccus suaedae]
MNLFWVINASNWKRLGFFVLAAFFTAGIVYMEAPSLPVFSDQDKPAALHRVEAEKPELALTFDISWGDQELEPILAALEAEKIDMATFFLSAAWAERHPELVQKIVDAGYEIGSHGYKHEHYTTWELEDIKKDMLTAHRVLTELTEEEPTLIRPPNGSFDDRVLGVAQDLGYQVIHWSVQTNDWQQPGVEAIVETATTNIQNGDILHFHASDSATETAEAMPIVLQRLREQGYHFVSISRLVSGADVDLDEAM